MKSFANHSFSSSRPASRNVRGQVAVEFMLYLAVFMVVLVAGYVVVLYVQGIELPFKESLVVKETGQTFSSALSLVKKGGPGFEYVISIPVAMFDHPYVLQINDESDMLVIDAYGSSQNITFSYPLTKGTYLSHNDDPQGRCVRHNGAFTYVQSDECNGLILLSNEGGNIIISPYGELQ